MPKMMQVSVKEMLKEHKHLVSVLKKGNPKELALEAKKQAKELIDLQRQPKYPGEFISKMNEENSKEPDDADDVEEEADEEIKPKKKKK